MELAFVVYLISIVEQVREGLTGAFVLGLSVIFMWTLGYFLWVVDRPEGDRRMPNRCWYITLIVFTVLCGSVDKLLPTQKAAYTIAGAYVTQKIAENEKVQEIGGKVLTIINQKLDWYIASDNKEKETK